MTKPLDRLTLLETFTRIAQRGSISAAARDIGISQASASRQLLDLEQRLGVQLAVRTTHSLTLTKAGEKCLAEAQLLLADWEAFSEHFAGENDAIAGDLKIVAPVALGQTIALDCALSFQKAHPGVALEWLLEDDPIRFSEIGCDLWIKIGDVPDETLIVRPLADVERIVVAAPGFVNGADTIGEPAALRSRPCAALMPFEGGRLELFGPSQSRVTLDAKVAFATNNIFAAKAAVLDGGAYAVLPRWLVNKELADGELVRLLPQWRARTLTINAAFAPSRRQTRRLRMFLETMSDGLTALGSPR